MGQACELLNVAPGQVRQELKARAAAREIEPITDLVEAWTNASAPEREAAVRMIGVAKVWDVLASVVA